MRVCDWCDSRESVMSVRVFVMAKPSNTIIKERNLDLCIPHREHLTAWIGTLDDPANRPGVTKEEEATT